MTIRVGDVGWTGVRHFARGRDRLIRRTIAEYARVMRAPPPYKFRQRNRPAAGADPDPAAVVRREARDAGRRGRLRLRGGRCRRFGFRMLERERCGGGAFAREFLVAQPGAAFLGLATQVSRVGAQQRLFDLAAFDDVRVSGTASPASVACVEVDFEPERSGTRAVALPRLASCGERDATLLAILVALDGEAHGAEPGFAVKPALGLPVALAGGAVGDEGAFASLATRLAPSCPGMRRVAPGCGVASCDRIAEQALRWRTVLAPRVLYDVETVQPVAAVGLGRLGLGDPADAGGASVGARLGPGLVKTDEPSGEPAQHGDVAPLGLNRAVI